MKTLVGGTFPFGISHESLMTKYLVKILGCGIKGKRKFNKKKIKSMIMRAQNPLESRGIALH